MSKQKTDTISDKMIQGECKSCSKLENRIIADSITYPHFIILLPVIVYFV